jgi:ubiquinone/menaquinone biosynthesis C-methylase UbiE
VDEHSSWAGRDERVFIHLPAERRILESLGPRARILDLGCGDGSHFPVLARGGSVVGMDTSLELIRLAAGGLVVAAEGEHMPFREGAFDLVYISHVLHHAADPLAVMSEVRRVLRPGGAMLVIETCEDNPLMRLARNLWPRWESVPVRSRFRYATLVADIRRSGFEVRATEQFNVVYWVWGFARRIIRPLERVIGTMIRLELWAVRRWRRYSAYGYVVAVSPSRAEGQSSGAVG